MKIPYETNYLYKIREGGMAIIMDADDGTPGFFTRNAILCEKKGHFDGYVFDRRENGKDKDGEQYDIVAFKRYANQGYALCALLSGETPKWDWEPCNGDLENCRIIAKGLQATVSQKAIEGAVELARMGGCADGD